MATTYAVTRIFDEFAPTVYRLARRMLGNDADAQDVTQDVFVQILRSLPSYRGEAALSTWLHRIAINAALSFRRRRAVREEGRLPGTIEDYPEDGRQRPPLGRCVEEPDKQAIEHDFHYALERAIGRLPPRYREVFVLADLEERSNAEIGAALGLSEPAVKSRLHRARLMMRKALGTHAEDAA